MAKSRPVKRTSTVKNQKSILRNKWRPGNWRLTRATTYTLAILLFGFVGGSVFVFSGHADTIPEFNVECGIDHYSKDDPIVFPGQPGAAHAHSFFGNKTTTYLSTPASIDSGASSCNYIGDFDHSAYWTPSIMYTNPDGSTGQYTNPNSSAVAYYRRPGGTAGPKVQAFPKGIVMIAGDSKATTAQSTNIIQWDCNGGDEHAELIQCPGGDSNSLVGEVIFPSCWDGVHLDSTNHKSHMAYANDSTGACPADHPVSLPQIFLNVRYPGMGGGPNYMLSSGMPMPGMTMTGAGIYSMHADFMEGWNQPMINGLIDNCINTKQNSCHTIQVWPGGDVTINGGVQLFNLNNYATTTVPTPTPPTPPAADTTPPSVSLTAPAANETVSGTVSISASAADNVAVKQVSFSVDGVAVGGSTTAPYSTSWNTASVSNGAHIITAVATDTSDNKQSTTRTVSVNNVSAPVPVPSGCTGVPTTPTSLRTSAKSSSSISLRWNSSTAAPGCTLAGYQVYRNNILVATVNGTTFKNTGLKSNTSYSYYVVAVDASGHLSAPSTNLTVKTSRSWWWR